MGNRPRELPWGRMLGVFPVDTDEGEDGESDHLE
jgi:hypothetical protein